jgi:polyhydroxyalkanoate synthase
MHSFYLRNMYQKNLLVKPGGIELLETPINITKIMTPSYILSTKEDHIAPWPSTYAATQIYDGPVTFVLSQSGHIAGVLNPPIKKKYGFWTNEQLPPRPVKWYESAQFTEGSWWDHWHEWQRRYGGKKVDARKAGSRKYKPIEAAPGAYARIRV